MKRRRASVLFRPALCALLLFASIAACLAGENDRHALRREWARITFTEEEFQVYDPALIPTSLALAAERAGCAYKDVIKESPTRFIRAESRRLAIVFCRRVVHGSDQVFDLTDLTRPRNLQFPFLARPNGFGSTSEPGAITWKRTVGVFEADTGSDTGPGALLRHSYRLGDAGSGTGFLVIRIEANYDGCKAGEWRTIWEAPR